MPNKPEYASNEADREGATNADPALEHSQPAKEVGQMPHAVHYPDSAHLRKTEQSASRETPGSTPWKAAVIRDLREGFGVEDIAHRMDCDVQRVRDFVADLRKHGLLPQMYQQARREWRAKA